jgi:hypothetical protein
VIIRHFKETISTKEKSQKGIIGERERKIIM